MDKEVFQSTHSRRVRPSVSQIAGRYNSFQSTHSRRVRQGLDTNRYYLAAVSIHALTKSATLLRRCLIRHGKFQSTHSRRVRPSVLSISATADSVSIHALTKSATLHQIIIISHICCFNPRTHEECDFYKMIEDLGLSTFQSTHSRRVRPRTKSDHSC